MQLLSIICTLMDSLCQRPSGPPLEMDRFQIYALLRSISPMISTLSSMLLPIRSHSSMCSEASLDRLNLLTSIQLECASTAEEGLWKISKMKHQAIMQTHLHLQCLRLQRLCLHRFRRRKRRLSRHLLWLMDKQPLP